MENGISEINSLRAKTATSIKQLSLNTALYLALYAGAVQLLEISITLFSITTIFLSFIIVRLFIIQHDCAHYAFFKTPEKNSKLGLMLASITHVPHYYWLRQHAYHHANSGNLQSQSTGGIWLLTIAEYKKLSVRRQLFYRRYRNPIIMVIAGGFFQFFICFKNPPIATKKDKKSRQSVILTNLIVAFRIGIFCVFFGWQPVVLVEIVSLWIAAMIAITLFYIQHNYKNTYRCNKSEWNHMSAAWKGSSFLNLSGIGHWLTGNIGYHHIHHLSVRIPNYHLASAHKKIGKHPDLTTLSLFDIPHAFSLKLWDEEKSQLVKFST